VYSRRGDSATQMTTRILLIANDANALQALAAEVARRATAVQVTTAIGGATELSTALLRGEIDIAVAALPSVTDADLGLIETTLSTRPNVSLILVTDENSSEFLLRTMRAGVREVVLPSSGADALEAALRRQLERYTVFRGPPKKGHVLAFMPAKGGSGATFLATNLAYALSQLGHRVALIDLNLQFGDVALFVSDRRPTSDIAEVSREVHRLDAAMLESSMLQASDNLWVLSAPDSPERSVDVKPESVERIVALARSRYDFVLLDVGRIMESISIRALDEAERIYVVLQSALPSLHDAKRLIGVLGGLGYDRDKLRIVVNRLDKDSEIGLGEVQKTLGHEVAVQIPNSYASVVSSVNHGVPILKQSPKDPVARALREWARALSPQDDKRSGWLRGMFGGRN
jgi:pilus assembly protein CpaE